ncbi:large-conductance mechanosensitive channel protein MscL [Parabacteroides sp. FAFU027]|uniref:large-conductance mechanosensitive channel protein MscL n=1 Tax=Parabacteroides sp. FAFU027 TaxID=2922715 RepID=UPI001FAFF00D|nr:large-conductance mechanosensitive channel protein MscL [Parabacteroides sp. FAFU027]
MKTKSFIQEFKEFAMRGNVVDMAIGIIIGAAFGKIISSLVADVIMPPLGLLLGGVDFASFKIVLQQADIAHKITEVSISYGNFIKSIVDFVIIALCIFMLIKSMNKLSAQKEAATPETPAPAEPSDEVKLLSEIRDILNKK